MASDTKNVKLGVCKVSFDGVDLGYTKGGVEVKVATETHQVEVDQFGKTVINEYIMARNATVSVPLAETTIENLAAIMPGATLVQSGGKAATGSITIVTNPAAGDTVVIGGTTVTFRSVLTGAGVEVLIGATKEDTVKNLVTKLDLSTDVNITKCDYSVAANTPAVLNVRYGNWATYGARGLRGTVGNAFTLAAGTAGVKVTVSGATLAGGTESLNPSIDVPTGTGLDLLSYAKELRLHPKGKPDSDKSEDFIIPLAGTAGALNFAYKLEEERIFNCEFKAYPDPTGLVFAIGD